MCRQKKTLPVDRGKEDGDDNDEMKELLAAAIKIPQIVSTALSTSVPTEVDPNHKSQSRRRSMSYTKFVSFALALVDIL